MDGLNKREGEKEQPFQFRALLINLLIIIGVVALGLVAVTQYLELRYKAHFLSTPCDLCRNLNEHLDKCFTDASTFRVENPNIEKNKLEINLTEYFNNITS